MTTKTAPKITTLDQIKKGRAVVAEAPSGNFYRIRPLNIERYAMTGNIPAALRGIARKGEEGLSAIFAEENDELLVEKGTEVRNWMDDLVRQVIVEPDISELDLDELPPVDYRWAAAIAMGEETKDGRGRMLWGSEPLSRWETFRQHHGCADDCDACNEVIESFRAWRSE